MDKISSYAPPAQTPADDKRPDEAYDIRIAADGTWFHNGAPIGRIALVKLFSTVLSRDAAGDYWLITPAERGRITVDDAPFVAVELRATGAGEAQRLEFRSNIDEWITAGSDHPLRVSGRGSGRAADAGGGLSESAAPYILVRDRLEARINRAAFYELVGLAVERETPEGAVLGVWSEQTFFPLGPVPPADEPA
jgi:hypothetical protein